MIVLVISEAIVRMSEVLEAGGREEMVAKADIVGGSIVSV
jgi:hypothetical protein